jgi:hypothetical protein
MTPPKSVLFYALAQPVVTTLAHHKRPRFISIIRIIYGERLSFFTARRLACMSMRSTCGKEEP